MTITEIVLIIFSCTAANHLGLVAAAEKALKKRLVILNCPKCLTFWMVAIIGIATGWNVITAVAAAFIAAYAAVWTNLFLGLTDKLYEYLYNKNYPSADDKEAADDEQSDNTDRTLP